MMNGWKSGLTKMRLVRNLPPGWKSMGYISLRGELSSDKQRTGVRCVWRRPAWSDQPELSQAGCTRAVCDGLQQQTDPRKSKVDTTRREPRGHKGSSQDRD